MGLQVGPFITSSIALLLGVLGRLLGEILKDKDRWMPRAYDFRSFLGTAPPELKKMRNHGWGVGRLFYLLLGSRYLLLTREV